MLAIKIFVWCAQCKSWLTLPASIYPAQKHKTNKHYLGTKISSTQKKQINKTKTTLTKSTWAHRSPRRRHTRSAPTEVCRRATPEHSINIKHKNPNANTNTSIPLSVYGMWIVRALTSFVGRKHSFASSSQDAGEFYSPCPLTPPLASCIAYHQKLGAPK